MKQNLLPDDDLIYHHHHHVRPLSRILLILFLAICLYRPLHLAGPLNYILVTDYLTKMGIKTVPQPPYRQDLALCDFWLFPKLGGCRYATIEEMTIEEMTIEEAVTKVIDTLTQEDFYGAFQKLLERYNKCIAVGGDYFEGE